MDKGPRPNFVAADYVLGTPWLTVMTILPPRYYNFYLTDEETRLTKLSNLPKASHLE